MASSVMTGPVCWLTLRVGLNDDVSAVLYTWAAFLAREGAPHLLALVRRPLDGFVLREPPEAWPLEHVNITPEDFVGLKKRGLIYVDPGDQWMLTPNIFPQSFDLLSSI